LSLLKKELINYDAHFDGIQRILVEKTVNFTFDSTENIEVSKIGLISTESLF